MLAASSKASEGAASPDLDVLERIQKRVLWLSTSLVHHANHERPKRSGVKVGGHQASSASAVSILTALMFHHMRAADRLSVKPHASPVLHAINYLLGRLDRRYLTELRAFGGLQSYPSRSKDPDPVDFSTGSVGIGATASIWSALARRYIGDRFELPPGGRHIALVGDAELDEGAVWEALLDPMVPRLGEVLWIVDLNRQSLDRVVPDIAAGRIGAMFGAAGWHVVPVKYGRRLRALFALDGGEVLRRRLDLMPNEEYQRLLQLPPEDLREAMSGDARDRRRIRRLLSDLDDVEVGLALRDLGGHDLSDLVDAFAETDRVTDQPSVVFAYTLKGWRLPTEGHPTNHSALLSTGQWQSLAESLGADIDDPWCPLEAGSPEAQLCDAVALRLTRAHLEAPPRVEAPTDLGRTYRIAESTQQSLGRFLVEIARQSPAVAQRIVTVSPDVASSTNLGGWINKVGIWNPLERFDWFGDDKNVLVRWVESGRGQHIELGIAEVNLVGLLSELGATWSRDGQPLVPIGTVYDPFVTRALEPWSFGIYAGGQSILVGTPSGVTLAPEGGAHQSVITPSIGLEQPACIAWEPAFAQDLEWTLLAALAAVGRAGGSSSYFRLSTRPVDQGLAGVPDAPEAREERRRQAVAGGYLLRTASGRPEVTLVAVGVVVPEVLLAADELAASGVSCDVVCLTSPDLVFRALRARSGFGDASVSVLDAVFPRERAAPIVSVIDGHPHTLAFLAAINGTRITTLGVDGFGQSGEVDDLYRYFGIDPVTIIGAAWDLIDEAAAS
jgi:pyruvate dehydrogenase E1 component